MQLKLRTKILFSTTLALAAVALFSTMLVLRHHRDSMLARATEHGEEVARGLAAVCRDAVLRGDADSVRDIVRAGLVSDSTLYVIVTGVDDLPLAVETSADAPSEIVRRGVSGRTAEEEGTSGQEAASTFDVRSPILGPASEGSRQIGEIRVGRSLSAVLSDVRRVQMRAIAVAVSVVGLAVLLLAWLVHRWFSRPIRRLKQGVYDTVSGRPGGLLPLVAADELGELSAQVHELTESLRRAGENLDRKDKEIDRKNVELFNTSQFLDSILTSSTDHAIIAEDLDGRILSVNEGARRTFGYSPEEIEGGDIQTLLSDPERGLDTVRVLYRRVLGGESDVSCEINGRHKDGRTFPAYFSFSLRSYASGEPAGFVIIARDLTRDKEEQELILRNRELERASRLKSEFLANMSHELRTPLNSVIGFSEVLLDGFFGELSEQQAEYVTDIHQSGRHLLDLINDILDISKIEAGRMELQLEDFDVTAAIERVVSMVAAQAKKKSIRIETNVGAEVHELHADSGRFKQIVLNLVSNAIKFTPEDGQVDIEAKRIGDSIRVAVADNGIGIPSQYLPTIFDKFQQVEGGYRRSHGGTGLGLAIVKDFVELHGGRVWVESVVGKGSRFTLAFPEKAGQTLSGDEEGPAESPVLDEPPEPEGEKHSVLVVDDDPFTLKLFFQYLSPLYRVETAMTGAEAIERVQESPPDVITLKVFLPDLDGWEVLRSLKENATTRRIPIVIVCAAREKGKGFLIGASDYFMKPIHRNELLSSLDAFSLRVPGRQSPPKILVIDDNPKDIRLFESYLRPAGFEITAARGGRAGIEKIRAYEPDLVILDLLMPGCSGFEVVEEIREEGRKMPILVLTNGYLSMEEKIRLMEEIYTVSSRTTLTRETLLEEVSRLTGAARVDELRSGTPGPDEGTV